MCCRVLPVCCWSSAGVLPVCRCATGDGVICLCAAGRCAFSVLPVCFRCSAGRCVSGVLSVFCLLPVWIPMTSLPPLKTPSCKGNKPTKVSRSYHQNWTKSSSAPCEGQTHVLDFEREVDLDIYYEGRTPVLEGDNLFDLKAETLGQFLKLLYRKATDQGWNDASSAQQIGLFNIAQDDSFYSRITISITKEHNYVEMTALRAQCERFLMGKYAQY